MANAVPQSQVAVLGASPKEERYSFQAVRMLKERGHVPIPVHPAGHTVDGIEGVKSLGNITVEIDTLTVYVNEKISSQQEGLIISLSPRRVIFNPGAENDTLAEKLRESGIETIQACTLVMLRTGQF